VIELVHSPVNGIASVRHRYPRATRSRSAPPSSSSRSPGAVSPRIPASPRPEVLSGKFSRRPWRSRKTRLVALLTAALIGLVPAGHSTVQRGATLDLDWDSCTDAQWTATGHGGLEAGSEPERQSTITSEIRRSYQGCANRFEIRNDPSDVNSGFRALWARYDSNEGTTGGVDFVYGLSFRLNVIPSYAHVWILHQRANIYQIDPDLAVAPHALMIRDGALQYRELTGAAVWADGEWLGWSNAQDRQTVLPDLSPNIWYDVMIRIRASEFADGLTQVYARQAGHSWPARPSWQNAGPSLPYVPGGQDPRIPEKIDVYQSQPGYPGLTGLYLEVGIYTGSSTWEQPQSLVQVYLDDLRRYVDLASARSGFPP
jgi:hypothetical protein